MKVEESVSVSVDCSVSVTPLHYVAGRTRVVVVSKIPLHTKIHMEQKPSDEQVKAWQKDLSGELQSLISQWLKDNQP